MLRENVAGGRLFSRHQSSTLHFFTFPPPSPPPPQFSPALVLVQSQPTHWLPNASGPTRPYPAARSGTRRPRSPGPRGAASAADASAHDTEPKSEIPKRHNGSRRYIYMYTYQAIHVYVFIYLIIYLFDCLYLYVYMHIYLHTHACGLVGQL